MVLGRVWGKTRHRGYRGRSLLSERLVEDGEQFLDEDLHF
jgi:hypothetical protein